MCLALCCRELFCVSLITLYLFGQLWYGLSEHLKRWFRCCTIAQGAALGAYEYCELKILPGKISMQKNVALSTPWWQKGNLSS